MDKRNRHRTDRKNAKNVYPVLLVLKVVSVVMKVLHGMCKERIKHMSNAYVTDKQLKKKSQLTDFAV